MWLHVILVSQTTVLLIGSRLLLYSISLSRNIIYVFNVVSSIFSSYATDYASMCVRMYECKITQRNNIRRANTYDPALKFLNEAITSDIQKHKQNLWKEHLYVRWGHRHYTYILWKTIHGISNRAPPPTLNTSITFNNKIATTPKHIAKFFTKQFTNTQHTRQTDTLTGQHIKYKDITSHSPQLRSKKQ